MGPAQTQLKSKLHCRAEHRLEERWFRKFRIIRFGRKIARLVKTIQCPSLCAPESRPAAWHCAEKAVAHGQHDDNQGKKTLQLLIQDNILTYS